MIIYLAGFVLKGDEEAKRHIDWRAKFIKRVSMLTNAEFIDPRERGDKDFDEGNPMSVFSKDCKHIKSSDLLLVNGDNLGVGSAQEILIAKYLKKHVIVVIPKNSLHRRTNIVFENKTIKDWIHPFLYCTCDLLIDDIEKLTKAKLEHVMSKQPKDLRLIDEAISFGESI